MIFSVKTIDDQASNASQINLNQAKLSFKSVLAISKKTAIKINTSAIFSDYMYYLKKDNCAMVTFTEENARKYMYKPKLLAYALYRNTDLYGLILRMNHMKSISDLTMERLVSGIIVPYSRVKTFFDEVLIKEKLPIRRNNAKVEEDERLTQK